MSLRAHPVHQVALATLVLLLAAPLAGAHQYVSTVTLVEGQNTLVSETDAFTPAPGVWLHHCDIIETGPKAFVQLETDDGGMIELGPATRFMAHLPSRRGQLPLVGPQYVRTGWVKLTVPKRDKGLPHRIDTSLVSVVVENGIVVLAASPDAVRFFVESGSATALLRGGSPTARTVVRAGSTFSLKEGLDRGSVAARAVPDFVKAMPPAFRDTLRPRLKTLKVRDVKAKPAADASQADIQAWLSSDTEIRQACASRH